MKHCSDAKSKFILIYELFLILNNRLRQFYFNPMIKEICPSQELLEKFKRRLGQRLWSLIRNPNFPFYRLDNFFDETFIFALKIFNKLFFVFYTVEETHPTCYVCKQSRLTCQCIKMNKQFFQMITILKDLELFNIVRNTMKNIFHEALDGFIGSICKGKFTKLN